MRASKVRARNFWVIHRSARVCQTSSNAQVTFRYIYYKLHLGWHDFWYYQNMSTYWYLGIISTRNFAFGSGRNRAISRLVYYSRRRREKTFNISAWDCRTDTILWCLKYWLFFAGSKGGGPVCSAPPPGFYAYAGSLYASAARDTQSSRQLLLLSDWARLTSACRHNAPVHSSTHTSDTTSALHTHKIWWHQ